MDTEPIPKVPYGKIVGLLEILDDLGGKGEAYQLARDLHYEYGDMLEVIKGARLLKFVTVTKGEVHLSNLGKKMLSGDINARKRIFKEQIKQIPIFSRIVSILKRKEDYRVHRDIFLDILVLSFPDEDPDQLLDTIIDWGRFAELLGYNADTQEIYLDQEN